MTTRDTLEQLLELHDEVQKLEEMIRQMFNRVYADYLRKHSDARTCNGCERIGKDKCFDCVVKE